MNTLVRNTLRALAAVTLAASIAAAQPTSTNSISLQAKLDGVAAGPVSLTVRFYTSALGDGTVGAPIVLSGVPVANGVVSVPVPVDATIFDGQTRYMGIRVNNGTELSPRTLVTSVPYAFAATAFAGQQFIMNSANDVTGTVGGAIVLRDTTRSPFRELGVDPNDIQARISTTGPQGPLEPGTLGLNPDGGLVQLGSSAAGWATDLSAGHATFNDTVNIGWQVTAFSPALLSVEETSPNRYPLRIGNDAGNAGIWIQTEASGNNAPLVVDVGGERMMTLRYNGECEVRVLQILGGSDIAEPVAITPTDSIAKPEPGMVMVIDRDHDGKLVPCSAAYDRAVAGVLSGANGLKPGMVLSAEGQPHAGGGVDTMPLAMTGRVWVLCEAAQGPIRRGDSLTTSATPGHAMAATDDAKAARAVIGKAMTELVEGRGMVLVLVNLQ